MKRPFISVIITAYNRREFIRDAVNSIINSASPKDEYEIIVIKNFRDEYVDGTVEKIGGKNIVADLVSIGAKVALGVEVASGDVITFLEDDDAYLPSRLGNIERAFEHMPSLIYYHNNVVVINEIGKMIYDKLIDETNIYDTVVAHDYEDKIRAFKKYGWNLGLRTSSMAVRRNFVHRWVGVIRRFPDLIDVLIFLLALVSDGAIYHDPRPLTYYRISGTSASSTRAVKDPLNRFSRAIRNATRHAVARHMFVTLAEKIGLRKYVRYDEATVIGGIYGDWGMWLSHAMIDLARCSSIRCVGSAMFGLTYLISPWLAKRLVYLYYTSAFSTWGLRS